MNLIYLVASQNMEIILSVLSVPSITTREEELRPKNWYQRPETRGRFNPIAGQRKCAQPLTGRDSLQEFSGRNIPLQTSAQ